MKYQEKCTMEKCRTQKWWGRLANEKPSSNHDNRSSLVLIQFCPH